jgi:hypothetical protein
MHVCKKVHIMYVSQVGVTSVASRMKTAQPCEELYLMLTPARQVID